MNFFYYPAACSLADHIALIETGLTYTALTINHDRMTSDGRDFRSLNPKGYVPALELEDGTILTENPVILNYIAEKSGKLLPRDGAIRWRGLEALAFMASEIHGVYQPFFRDFPAPEKARSREKLAKNFTILADQMGEKAFLVSEEMTIADCYLYWVLMAAQKFELSLPDRLKASFDRLNERPSIRQALAEEGLA